MQHLAPEGLEILKSRLSPSRQAEIVAAVRDVVRSAPVFFPQTPRGRPMRVQMTAAGRYGWFSDRQGFRYISRHPSGLPWPAIPDVILQEWRDLISTSRSPDCCLINFYGEGARMGLHRDVDERDFSWPVLSISLGDPATFRIGGTRRSDPTKSTLLQSGDVVVLGGDARLVYHGIDRIKFRASTLLPEGGRINLTLRVVD